MKNNYHKENLKENILILTVKIIKEEGYQSVSVRKIANHLDVSPTAIYRHYNSLEELFTQAIVSVSHEFTNLLKTSLKGCQISPTQEIATVGVCFVNYATTSKNEFDFLFLSNYSLKNVSLNHKSDYPLILFMDSIINQAIKENNFKYSKEILFNQLWCFIFGYAVLVSKKQIELNEELIDATVKSFLTR
ncbi:TetR/AcrR family transcriptional regulator [Vagococcus silagei]|nr:TetR/AcrR family transcriptional regulator [Vagococcus silagei]